MTEFKSLPRVTRLDAQKVYDRCVEIVRRRTPDHVDQFGTMLFRVGLLELYVKRAGGARFNFAFHMDDGRCFALTTNGGVAHWTTSAENTGPDGATPPTDHDYAEMRLVL